MKNDLGQEVEVKKDGSIYKKFAVEMQARERIYGGLPRHEDVIDAFTTAKIKDNEKARGVAEQLKEDIEPLDQEEELSKMWCGFRSFNGSGIFLADYQIKAMLRESAKTLGFLIKSFRQTFQHGLFIKPTDIRLSDKPDGYEDFFGHVMGPRGDRSILKRADYSEKRIIKYEAWIVDNGTISDDKFKKMVELSQEIGLGSMRSFQKGKLNLLKFKKQDD
jgi:hypothetical protein